MLTMPSARKEARLGEAGYGVVIWATGFTRALDWIDAPVAFDGYGYPCQHGWDSGVPGLHFLGFNYLEHRRSGILYGAGVEAQALAHTLAGQSQNV